MMIEDLSRINDEDLTVKIKEDPQDIQLYKSLVKYDPRLGSIFLGVNRVLKDDGNPDRYSQAASSIRGLTDLLLRKGEDEKKGTKLTNEESKRMEKLQSQFDEDLATMPTSNYHGDERSQIDKVNKMFDGIKKSLVRGVDTMRQSLFRFYGGQQEVLKQPKGLRERILNNIKIWGKCHSEYFIKCAHYSDGSIQEEEFIEKWITLKGCLYHALSRFYEDDAPLLDSLLGMENPPI